MKQKLIFLDIDGTLTEPGCNVPPDSALRAIRAAQANGHRVFLCTGRSYGMLQPLLQYGFDGAVGGAGGYVFCGDKVLFDCPMTPEQTRTAMEALARGRVLRTIEARDAAFGDEDLSAFLSGGSDRQNSELVRWRRMLKDNFCIRPMREYDGRPIYKVIVMCQREAQLTEARRLLEQDFRFCMQGTDAFGCLNGELINRKFDKGRGILRICEYLHADPADTIGFGDSMNDLEMTQTVGVSVCMANGSEELKKRCSRVCPAVGEDGLAREFAALGLTGAKADGAGA